MTEVQSTCLFCSTHSFDVILENQTAYAISDGFPVTEGHTLIIPKRHVEDYFGLTQEELLDCDDLLKRMSEKIKSSDKAVDGFNIGMNSGAVAGQTIFHCHIHLIPRRKGDMENPKGGVRHVIPGKGYY